MSCAYCDCKLNINYQYIYDRVYKNDCEYCMHFNCDNIYCLCNNDGNVLQKVKISTCENCEKNNNTILNDIFINRDEYKHHNDIKFSYKELYTIAKIKNVKYRSIMSKEELYRNIVVL